MSKAFLPTILEQKEKEVAQLVMEDLQPLRQTYRLYDFLKSNQNKLQIISEVKGFIGDDRWAHCAGVIDRL